MHQLIFSIRGIFTILAFFLVTSLANSQSETSSSIVRPIAMGQYPFSSDIKKPEPYVNLDIQKIGVTGYVKRVLPFGCPIPTTRIV